MYWVSPCVVTELVLKIVALTEFFAQPLLTGTTHGCADSLCLVCGAHEDAVSTITERYRIWRLRLSIIFLCAHPGTFFFH
ncbi:MAG: hypothetical protein ACYSX1_02140, partial [Planctomycetota bacterium]